MHMLRKTLKTLMLAVYFTAYSYVAQASPEYIPIQQRAQAQSLTGASLLNDSLYTNPATSSFTKAYSVEGTYGMGKNLAASIVDTRTEPVGGGLGYFRQQVGNNEELLQGVKIQTSTKASPTMGVGAAGKIMWGPGINGVHTNLNDFDLGVFSQYQVLQYGATVRNVLGGNPNFEQYREWSVGGRLNWEQTMFIGVSADSKFTTLKPYQVGVGAEYISPYFFSIKGGYRYRLDNSTGYWSAGGSLLAPKMALHYAVEFPNNTDQKLQHTLAASLLF